MLACVCQPAETKLYKGGHATSIGPLGGPRRPLQRPRSLKSRPPKPPPKPHSYSTTSDDASSSKSPKCLLSLRKIEKKAKSTKISTSSREGSKSDNNDLCNGIVTITDNDGKIYCVDNLILVGEDVLGKIKSDLDDSSDERIQPASTKDQLTVKQKNCDQPSRTDGTEVFLLLVLLYGILIGHGRIS